MKLGAATLSVAMITSVLLFAATPTQASFYSFVPDPADCGPSGDCNCPSNQNCDDEEAGGGWNPTFICPFGENDTLGALLECLADGYQFQYPPQCPPTAMDSGTTTINDPEQPSDLEQNPPGGDPDLCNDPQSREDYTVVPLPSPLWGLKIVRNDATETDRLIAWENIASILETSIQVNREGLVARIGLFTEKPARQGGLISVTLNDHSVVLNTALHQTPDDLSEALASELKLIGYRVIREGGFLYILNGPLTPEPMTRLSMRSTDPRVISTRLALLPFEETGLAGLGVLENEGSGEPQPTPVPVLLPDSQDPPPGVDDNRNN